MEKYVEEIIEVYKRQSETMLTMAEKTDEINKRLIRLVITIIISLSFVLCFIVGSYFFSDYQYPTESSQELQQNPDGSQTAKQEIK